VKRVGVDVLRDLGVDTSASLTAADAEVALETELGHAASAERAELVVGRFGGGVLLWQVDVRDSAAGSRYWVDAHDGSVVASRSLATHLSLGSVYTQNSEETPTPVDLELTLIDSAADPLRLNGWSGLLTVANYVSGNSQDGFVLEQTVVPTAGENFLYPPPADATDPTDAFAQVNLYYHLTTVRGLFQGLGVDVDGNSFKLTAVANAQEDNMALDNAFFSQMGIGAPFASPNLIAIGQGSINDFAYDSDVFKHEFGHYVSHNAVGYNLGQAHFDELGISPFSGSIDEGIADYFACSDNDDAELGEASLELLGSGRDLTDTSAACPDDMVGEVHADGEIIGSFGWSLRVEFGKVIADQLVWGAVSSLLPGANFDDFATGILATAGDLVESAELETADVTTIEGMLAARGLDNCGRVIALSEGEVSRSTLFGLDLIGLVFGADCATVQQLGAELPSLFHYSWTPAAGDVGVEFTIDMSPQGGGALDYSVFARAGEPVGFTNGQFLPEVTDFDRNQVFTTEQASFIIDAASDPPFDPSTTYDIVMITRSCPTLGMEVRAASYMPPIGEGGAGAGGSPSTGGNGAGGGGDDDTIEDDDGCGCKLVGASQSDAGAPSALLALAALGLLGSRRRRR